MSDIAGALHRARTEGGLVNIDVFGGRFGNAPPPQLSNADGLEARKLIEQLGDRNL